MSPFLALLRRHPVARTCSAAILLYGFAGAATGPYLPVVAIRELGMSNRAYSAAIFAAAVASVLASIGLGLIADRRATYRRPMMIGTAIGAAGYAAVWLWPSPGVLAAVMIGPLAAYNAAGSLIFAKLRSHAADFTAQEAETAGALLRMMISVAWVLVPGAVGLALSGAPSLLPAFALAAGAAGAGLALIALRLPADRPGGTGPAPAGPRDLLRLVTPGLALRILGVALVSSVLHVNAAVLPLIVTGQAGGDVADVGVIAGYVALLEVVFIFVWARFSRHLSMGAALVLAMALYLAYLATLAAAPGMGAVHAASVLGGIAAAAIISLPIPYLLDLIEGRPGLSAALLAVNQFVAAGIGAGLFAIGTAIGGYPAAAVLGGVAGLAGAVLLLGIAGWRLRRGLPLAEGLS